MPAFNTDNYINSSLEDIVDYINSLPDDIESINISYMSIANLPPLKRFHKLKKLDCSNNQLTNLSELTNELQYLICSNNQLTSLPELNNELIYLNCSYNQLTNLPELNNKLIYLNCSNNQLTSIPELNNELKYLHCSNNQLTNLLELNNELIYLNCSNNQLTNLPELNNNLRELHCYNNSLLDILQIHYIYLNKKINIMIKNSFQRLYRFKFLFWSLKYKTKLRDWLWVRVRLPKIEKMYHPSKLNELLNERDNITDEELDNLISTW